MGRRATDDTSKRNLDDQEIIWMSVGYTWITLLVAALVVVVTYALIGLVEIG